MACLRATGEVSEADAAFDQLQAERRDIESRFSRMATSYVEAMDNLRQANERAAGAFTRAAWVFRQPYYDERGPKVMVALVLVGALLLWLVA